MAKTRSVDELSSGITMARLSFETDLARLMAKRPLSRAALAELLGSSAAFVSKLLGGSNNYTLKTMVRVATAAGGVLEVRIADKGKEVVRVVDLETAAHIDDGVLGDNAAAAGNSFANVLLFRSKGRIVTTEIAPGAAVG